MNTWCKFLITDLENAVPEENSPVHVINIDIQDNHEEATLGAFMICELAFMVSHLVKIMQTVFMDHGRNSQ